MTLKIHITLLFVLLYNLFIAKKEIYFIAYLFIIMHELSHMIMALLLKVDIEEIVLLPFGATAKYRGKITLTKEFIIALTGPVASLLFAYLYHHRIYFFINLLIALFNCIPIYPLDGGRMIKVLCITIFGEKWGKKINMGISITTICVLLFFSIDIAIHYHNYYLLLLSMYLMRIYQTEMRKEKILSIINYLQIDK